MAIRIQSKSGSERVGVHTLLLASLTPSYNLSTPAVTSQGTMAPVLSTIDRTHRTRAPTFTPSITDSYTTLRPPLETVFRTMAMAMPDSLNGTQTGDIPVVHLLCEGNESYPSEHQSKTSVAVWITIKGEAIPPSRYSAEILFKGRITQKLFDAAERLMIVTGLRSFPDRDRLSVLSEIESGPELAQAVLQYGLVSNLSNDEIEMAAKLYAKLATAQIQVFTDSVGQHHANFIVIADALNTSGDNNLEAKKKEAFRHFYHGGQPFKSKTGRRFLEEQLGIKGTSEEPQQAHLATTEDTAAHLVTTEDTAAHLVTTKTTAAQLLETTTDTPAAQSTYGPKVETWPEEQMGVAEWPFEQSADNGYTLISIKPVIWNGTESIYSPEKVRMEITATFPRTDSVFNTDVLFLGNMTNTLLSQRERIFIALGLALQPDGQRYEILRYLPNFTPTERGQLLGGIVLHYGLITRMPMKTLREVAALYGKLAASSVEVPITTIGEKNASMSVDIKFPSPDDAQAHSEWEQTRRQMEGTAYAYFYNDGRTVHRQYENQLRAEIIKSETRGWGSGGNAQ